MSNPTEEEFQRAGLLSVLTVLATDSNVAIHTRMAVKEATLKVLNEHPVRDEIENLVRFKMR